MKGFCKLAWPPVLTGALLSMAMTIRADDATVTEVFQHPASATELTTLLGAVAKTSSAAAVLRGNFVQRKFLHELPQPLQSSGEFLVARGAGVDWHTLKPFDSEVLMTPKALIQRGPDGKPQRVNASQQPGLAAVSQVFDALFALDIDTLSQSFRLFGEKDASSTGGWRLGLVPREPAFAKLIARIVVNGADEPKLITLFEASGDRTEIELADIKTATALTDADRQRFQ